MIAESVFTIVMVSIERFIIIRRPFESRKVLTKKRTVIVIVVTWMMAALIMTPLILHRQNGEMVVPKFAVINNVTIQLHNFTELPDFCAEVWNPIWKKQVFDMTLLAVLYMMPGIIISVLYSVSGCALTKGVLHVFENQDAGMTNSANVVSERKKIAYMLLLVAVLFVSCWLPLQVVTVILDFYADDDVSFMSFETQTKVVHVALFIGHCNCVVNPMLYFLLNTRFRNSMMRLCRRNTQNGTPVESGVRPLPPPPHLII